MALHIDIGGEGRYAGAWNVNPARSTSTTGTPGRPIPRLIQALGEALPFADASVARVTVENAPIRPGTVAEIARVLAPGGEVHLLHPIDYAIQCGAHDAVAGALRIDAGETVRSIVGDMARTVLYR